MNFQREYKKLATENPELVDMIKRNSVRYKKPQEFMAALPALNGRRVWAAVCWVFRNKNSQDLQTL